MTQNVSPFIKKESSRSIYFSQSIQ